MIVNVIVTQHNRRPSAQISRKPVVLGYIVAGFGWFWLFPCFSNYGVNEGKDVVSRRNVFQRKRNLQKLSIPIELTVNETVLPSGATQWLLIIAEPL